MKVPTDQLPEIWGGVECTINRIEDRFMDQCDFNTFYNNIEFADAIIDLGIKQIRFPVLWEKHQPSLSTQIDWSFAEDCLNKFRSHNIIPIVGLLHHGSGPAFTNLLQDDFPALFANYASKVAARFPWVQYYTPVNEPLTTARFSGLYGLWYPHKNNDVCFVKMLLNQLKASVLAMQEIRKINPAAKFVQTEDLGKTYSTPLLSYQANFENQRRWLTYDILCGKLHEAHPLWNYVMRLGIKQEELHFFTENSCPPDIIGINHYLTSERFLDEDIEHYPVHSVGGNSLHRYADVEAVRVPIEEPHGLEHLMLELAQRYSLPIAITEVHLHCTREEQLRWFNDVYQVAIKLKNEGINIIAVTAWALFGSFGWNKLLTSTDCEYETGVFDISAGYARPTALFHFIKKLIANNHAVHALSSQPGWWKLNARFYQKTREVDFLQQSVSSQPLLIIGKTGTLGRAFSRICAERNIDHLLLARSEADLNNEEQLSAVIARYHPWAVINCAGYVKVDEAETEIEDCYRDNLSGAEKLARVCRQHAVKLLTFSTDLVFDGIKNEPYLETDLVNPLNAYGHSKQLAERAVSDQNPDALIIRTAAFFGCWDKHNFAHQVITQLELGKQFYASDDIYISPTYLPHLVHASLNLLIDDASGIWHLANNGCITWYEFARKIIDHTHLNAALVKPVYNMQTAAKRPAFSALGSCKYRGMPSLDEAIHLYVQQKQVEEEIIIFNHNQY